MSGLTVLELFAGIGGLSLGLERAGFTIAGQVEADAWCRMVLARHWPEVPRHDDAATVPAWWASRPRPQVDLLAGGFPCQPFSAAGHHLGASDPRWMWPAMADAIRLVRPRVVLVENVPALLRDRPAFGRVLSDLAGLGLDAEWTVLSACALGAPHVRRRLLLVAYPHRLDGPPWLGPHHHQRPVQPGDGAAGAWRDRVDRAVAASRADDRGTHRSAARMVTAAGNAVVPAIAEHIGHLIAARLTDAAFPHREAGAA